MKSFIWRLRYFLLCLYGIPFSLFWNPWFTMRICLTRFLYLVTRRFCGPSFRSPITGELIFNTQSLINAFGMQVVGELDGGWQQHLRETPAPVVLDVGSNIGQFAALVRSLNPGAKVFTIDPWPQMAAYVEPGTHRQVAVGITGVARLTKSKIGWTGSTEDGYYDGDSILVSKMPLDDLWELMGSPRIDVLKIDVDGAEAEVIHGAREVLRNTKWVVIECNAIPEPLQGFPADSANGCDAVVDLR